MVEGRDSLGADPVQLLQPASWSLRPQSHRCRSSQQLARHPTKAWRRCRRVVRGTAGEIRRRTACGTVASLWKRSLEAGTRRPACGGASGDGHRAASYAAVTTLKGAIIGVAAVLGPTHDAPKRRKDGMVA